MSKKISLKKKEKSTSKEINEESKEEMKQISKKEKYKKKMEYHPNLQQELFMLAIYLGDLLILH